MIGLLGGTFDPIHYGHLRIALEAKEALGLDEVRFIPCRQPPHRDTPGASPQQRLELLRLAVADMPGFAVDTRELERDGPSYMVDTLASLRGELGDAPLCLILGQDAFLGLPRWHRWRELTDFAHLAVVRRPGPSAPLAGDLALLAEAHRREAGRLRAAPAGGICFLETPLLDISATRIRELLRSGRDPRYLLPDAVLKSLRRSGLYST
ncbi:nicotinate-nucleotide adenylyltransferase [Methylogaea oryzae]|uniref:Probable nicotinate-nucleotide adenylyltransferase n=2 Tax=Methylogaea oryzae TaxID=1295382 RepID=A0A8D4VU78_9GAMM|nr:nicotinate-nucleotide adenylyltransferase [Methylogaea oryzae]BBL72732.1 putative nicotinate-nucleotide adenylyltransferase [Methylogaea oryzae]